MRNSLVFHDIDTMTTLMMHTSPALTGTRAHMRCRCWWPAAATARARAHAPRLLPLVSSPHAAWAMRWTPPAEWTAGMSAAEVEAWNTASWAEMALLPVRRARGVGGGGRARSVRPTPTLHLTLPQLAVNIVWVAFYYLVVFILVNKRIKARGYQNMCALNNSCTSALGVCARASCPAAATDGCRRARSHACCCQVHVHG